MCGDDRGIYAGQCRTEADTFLNAMGLLPFLGDGTKVVRVIGKYLEWLPKNMGAIGRWLFKQFSDAQQLRMSALPILGYTDEIAVLIARSDAEELVARGNNLNEIQELVKRHPNKLNLSTKAVDFINWNNVDAAVRLYWPKAQGNLYAQARSTEAAVEYLNTLGYNTLFVGSRRANYPTGLRIGSDIVAENPVER